MTEIIIGLVGITCCIVSVMLYTGEENPELRSFRLGVANIIFTIGIAIIALAVIVWITKK